MGFLDVDKECIEAIVGASHWGIEIYLKKLFTTLIVSGQLFRPDIIWNNT